MSAMDDDNDASHELNDNSSMDWVGDGGDVDASALLLFASNRVDSMYLRFKLLSALIKAPLRSKAATLRLLHISRQYLGRLLREWRSLGMIDVRDMSSYDAMIPVMALYLAKRPVITITRVNGDVEDVKDISGLKEVIPAITSNTRQVILTALRREEETRRSEGRAVAMTVKELQEKVGGKDIHRHIRILLKARLLLKLRIPESGWWQRGGKVAVVRNYRNIRFSLQPHTYRQPHQ